MTVLAVVGAQYGSEGKGAIVSAIAHNFDLHIRTGAPNAGHTYYMDDPKSDEGERIKFVARQVPVGAKNPEATLVIGPGAVIDIALLVKEVNELEAAGVPVRDRLFVDKKAIVLDPHLHHAEEGGVHGRAHELIGSTGEGVGLARMAHMGRTTVEGWHVKHAGDDEPSFKLADAMINLIDGTSIMVNGMLESGASCLLEGTQGSGLSLVHGFWPYVTSTDTNSAQLCVDAGLSPMWLSEVLLVARSFPIRVAGNSGPLRHETTFDQIGVEPEFTTVTKKQRRIGAWDDDLFAQAVRLNGPHPTLALTFADYLDPDIAGCDDERMIGGPVSAFIDRLEEKFGVGVVYVSTGPDSVITMEAARWATR